MSALSWNLLLALGACAVLHLSAIAVAGLAFGVGVRRFCFGLGPTLWQGRRFQLKLLPLGGFVAFEDSSRLQPDLSDDCDAADDANDADGSDASDGFDRQPRYRQVLISLAGCAALIVLALVTLHAQALPELARGFGQILGGALSPLDEAQLLLRAAHERMQDSPAAALLGLVAVKFAALNLLPFAPFNGASAIGAALRGHPAGDFWSRRWSPSTIWMSLALGGSWIAALTAHTLAR